MFKSLLCSGFLGASYIFLLFGILFLLISGFVCGQKVDVAFVVYC